MTCSKEALLLVNPNITVVQLTVFLNPNATQCCIVRYLCKANSKEMIIILYIDKLSNHIEDRIYNIIHRDR